MQDGLANVCLVGANITVVAAKVEGNIPRKRGAASAGYDKALDRFFDKVLRLSVLLGSQGSHGRSVAFRCQLLLHGSCWLLLQHSHGHLPAEPCRVFYVLKLPSCQL